MLCSIHQPRSAVWLLLDTAYFLSRGRLVYAGPTAGAVDWFRTLGYVGRTFAGNAADFVLDLTAVDFDKAPEVFGKKTMRSDDDVARAADAFAERRPAEALIAAPPSAAPLPPAPRPCYAVQCRVLAWRVALGHLRHPGNFAARAVLTVLCGLLCWAVFGAQAPQDLAEVETDPDAALRHATYRGAAFTIPLFVTLICFVPLGCLMYDRQFFIRERRGELYSCAAYAQAYAAVELVCVVLINFPVAALYELACGLGGTPTGYAAAVVLLGAMFGQVILCACAVSPSGDVAFVFAAAVFIHAFVTSGLLVSLRTLAPAPRALSLLSPLRFAYDLVLRVELGPAYAAREGYDATFESSVGRSCGVLAAMFLFYHGATYLGLRFLYRKA